MTSLEVMKQVQEGKITPEQAQELLRKKKLSLKVSNKGAVQVDGLRRFPVTLYKSEWALIFDMKDEIEKFIVDHAKQLTDKKGDE